IIHRDLAARNVLLADDGMPVVCDFGLARHLPGDGKVGSGGVIYYRAHPTGFCPPQEWLAPESWPADSGATVSPKSDVWQIGLTIWEILSQGDMHPFGEFTPRSRTLIQQGKLQPAWPRGTPDKLRPLLGKIFQPLEEHRATSSEVVLALEDLLRDLDPRSLLL